MKTASADLSVSNPFPGASEQDCCDWWSATSKAVRRIDADLRSEVQAVGLSGQMHGAVLLDQTCRPIRSVMLWNDARSIAECADIVSAEEDIWKLSGVLPTSGITAPKMLWLQRNEPEVISNLAYVILPKDYIGYLLHGKLFTDPSDASGTSLFDQEKRDWSEHLCQISGVDVTWLPEVRHGDQVAGTLLVPRASELGLPAGVPIAVGAGDVAAGALGIGAINAGDGFLSLGTSAQIFVTTADYRPMREGFIHSYAHAIPNRWFQMAAMLNGARPLAWFSQLMRRPLEVLLSEAENVHSVPLFLPYLSGEKTPHGDSSIRASFYGLSETTTHGSMMRAIIEAVAFACSDAASFFSRANTLPDTLFAIGGGTRSSLLMQIVADVVRCRIGVSNDADIGPALGAARLARVACGAGTLEEVILQPNVSRWFEPCQPRCDELERRLRGYRMLYPALTSVQKTLDVNGDDDVLTFK